MMLYLFLFGFTFTCAVFLFAPLWREGQQRTAILLGMAWCVVSMGLYLLWGNPQVAQQVAKRQERLVELSKDIERYSIKLKQEPKDLETWVSLSQAFMESGQFAAAENSLKQAVLLSNGHPALILAYAKAQIFANEGNVTKGAKKALDMVLLQEPTQPEARYFTAVWLLQNGKMEEAMKSMKTLYHSLPDDSPLKAMIDAQIGRSKK